MAKKSSSWEISCFGWDKISGVYCVYTVDIDRKSSPKLMYIGSSKNIGKRLSNNDHPYKTLWDGTTVTYIKFKETKDYKNLERRLIVRLKPKLNNHHTHG